MGYYDKHTHFFAGNYEEDPTPRQIYDKTRRKLNHPAEQRKISQAVETAVDKAIEKALDDLLKKWN